MRQEKEADRFRMPTTPGCRHNEQTPVFIVLLRRRSLRQLTFLNSSFAAAQSRPVTVRAALPRRVSFTVRRRVSAFKQKQQQQQHEVQLLALIGSEQNRASTVAPSLRYVARRQLRVNTY
jgi:hypothetical protein